MEKICVVGLGYIGLPTASLLAVRGYDVRGVDVREDVVAALNAGQVLIHEPGLDAMVKSAVGSGKLRAFATPGEADIFILALPTPFKENKKPDLSFVRQGVDEIAPFLQPGNTVILESTSPVGTTELITQWLHEKRPDLSIAGQPGSDAAAEPVAVAHCPERVLPGRILRELVQNDRIVGGIDQASTAKVAKFYKNFVEGKVCQTTARAAEMSKLVENSFRDVNIAFANELSLICEDLHVDVWEVINLANRHPRVSILSPGPGVGGHCISVDPWFLVDAAPDHACLIRVARQVNDAKADWVHDKIAARAQRYSKPVIACMGLAFKPDVDDLRESPAVHITRHLAANPDWNILAVEPNIRQLPDDLANLDNVVQTSRDDALARADIIAFLTGHKEFCEIAAHDLFDKVVIDACGLFRCKGNAD